MNGPASFDVVIPRLRGLLHVYAFWFAAVAAAVLVALAPTGQARVAAAIYGAGLGEVDLLAADGAEQGGAGAELEEGAAGGGVSVGHRSARG